MKRRDFIALLGGAAVWPLAASAQQPAMPVIGFLHVASPNPSKSFVAAFRRGLNDAGYIEGRNVTIEFRWAEDQRGRLPELAADLVSRHVAVIVAGGGLSSALAAKEATTTIPIVFVGGFDPLQSGLVASYNRPGGNATGISSINSELEAKRLGLVLELVPTARTIAFLTNPNSAIPSPQIQDMQTAAHALGKSTVDLKASSEHDFNVAFASMAQRRIDALIVVAEPFFSEQSDRIAALAVRYAVPTISFNREFAQAGGYQLWSKHPQELSASRKLCRPDSHG
jgi:putative ABC transport system substrate-binding protein